MPAKSPARVRGWLPAVLDKPAEYHNRQSVYAVVERNNWQMVKIGKAHNVHKRLTTLQTGNVRQLGIREPFARRLRLVSK
jgi:hypothetical protein